MLVGGLYGLALLKIMLSNFADKLERVARVIDDHEHRITRLEK